MPSTAPTATASLRRSLTRASVTVDTAQSTLPAAGSAIERDAGDRVVHDLLAERARDVLARCSSTGDAAPMFVPGAMQATWPASVMNVPALAAWPPGGATHTIVGNGASRSAHHDALRRVEAAARRVELDDDGVRAVAMRLRDAVLEVAGHDASTTPLVGSTATRGASSAARAGEPASMSTVPRTSGTANRKRPM